MPAQKTTANKGFLDKMRNSAFAKHVGNAAKKEINYGPEQLPAGIRAICQIHDIGLKTYEKDTKMKTAEGKSAAGEYYFYAVGVIVEPEMHVYPDGVERKIAGRQVRINVPCIATKTAGGKVTSQEDQCDKIMQEIGKLTSQDYIADASFDQIPDLIEGVKQSKPYFNFATSVKAASVEKGPDGKTPKYPEGVWENWNGNRGLESYQGPDAQATTTQDDTGGSNDQDNSGDDQPDLDALVEAATNQDQDAIDKLTELATAVGVEIGPDTDAPANTVNGADSWQTVREWIDAGGAPELPADETAWEPAVKEMVKYKAPADPKKPNGAKKTFDCEVTGVNKGKRLVTMKNPANKAVYKDVSWDDVEPA